MYSTCLFCHAALGTNDAVERFPVGRRIAFDAVRGRLWAVCGACGQWNLAPLDERWEAVEDCERQFRATSLRYSTGNVGLAWLPGDTELVRVGRALRPEVAAWRFGRVLLRRRSIGARIGERVASLTLRAMDALSPYARLSGAPIDDRAALARLIARHRGSRVLDVVRIPRDVDGGGDDALLAGTDLPIAVVRYRHLEGVALVRPEAGHGWALLVPHDRGTMRVEGDAGIRTAAKLLATVNGTANAGGVGREVLELAARKVDESAQPDSYFNRVLALALRSHWGREGDAESGEHHERLVLQRFEGARSDVERLAFRLTGRTFWGHGGIGSEPRAGLLDVPLVDRLALEMAAHEEAERRALDGELAELEEAWRDAEEIAAIADAMFLPAEVDAGVRRLRLVSGDGA
ncbi:MAG TPA: hypothetical protein VFJ74_13440 [Gemmatimonadaceae bacterium]|nr:hypothetical protein [Gemmatimonadaceae bacterium]